MKHRSLGLGSISVLLLAIACESTTPRLPFPTVEPWYESSTGRPGPGDESNDGDERKLWDEAREVIASLEESGDLLEEEPLLAYLQSLVESIEPSVRDGGPKLRALLLADSTRNAAALPDGQLLLTLGMLAAVESEAELVMVLGHEMAHVLLRHSLVQARYDAQTPSHVDRMRLSRELERRADALGLHLTVAAGFSPEAAIRALVRFEQDSPTPSALVKSWESHHGLRSRRRNLTYIAKQIDATGRRGDSEAFTRLSRSIRLRAAELALSENRVPDARALIDRQLAEDPASGRAHFLRGETTRRLHPELSLDSTVRLDFERAVELAPHDPDALRALGLFLWETGAHEEAVPLLRRYLEARPDAVDRKIIERYLAPSAYEGRSDRLIRAPESRA